MQPKVIERIPHKNLPMDELRLFKEQLYSFEEKLGRGINAIDIIGEIEVCNLLEFDMVKSGNNEAFDAFDKYGKPVQIKATRAKRNNSRTSAIKKDGKPLSFDYILLARYPNVGKLERFELYKMSATTCEDFFQRINSPDKIAGRVKSKGKIYRSMEISQFISHSEEKYDFEQKQFINNHK